MCCFALLLASSSVLRQLTLPPPLPLPRLIILPPHLPLLLRPPLHPLPLFLSLQAGDPLIFGRTRSEIEHLLTAGVSFELVPGLSSLTAAPLLAGVPLTDPELSRSFAVLSGHDATR